MENILIIRPAGFSHYAKRRGINFDKLLTENKSAALNLLKEFESKAYAFPQGIYAWENVSLDEDSLFGNADYERELESFHDQFCILCNDNNYEVPKFKSESEMSDEELILLDHYKELQKRIGPKKKVKLIPHRGDFIWCFICSSCNKTNITTDVHKIALENKIKVKNWLE